MFILVVGVLLGLLARSGSKGVEVVDKQVSIEEEYMTGCSPTGNNTAYCACTYDYLVSVYGKNGLMEIAFEYYRTEDFSKEMENAVIYCADKL